MLKTHVRPMAMAAEATVKEGVFHSPKPMPRNRGEASQFDPRPTQASISSIREISGEKDRVGKPRPVSPALRPVGNAAKYITMKPLTLLALLALGVGARAASLDAPPTDVIMLDHAKVDDSFAKGLPLLLNTSYKISAGRRVMAGTVEFHERDTDIIYVTEGTATFITGGTMVDAKTTGLNEVHATSITGGVTHHLSKGDLIVIPAGTPHWFKEVPGTFLYLLIKVTK